MGCFGLEEERTETKLTSRISTMSKPGKYPIEYNPRVHGPYEPGRFYGKADVALQNVKIGEFYSWLGRRDLSLNGAWGVVHRGYQRFFHRSMNARWSGFSPYAKVVMCMSAFWFPVFYNARSYH